MQLTSPTQTIVHHDEKSSHMLSTVWLKEGNIVMLEMAMFHVDEYTGDVEYGDPVFIYSVQEPDVMPGEAMSIIQGLSHDIMLRAFHASKGQTLDQRCDAMFEAYRRARGFRR